MKPRKRVLLLFAGACSVALLGAGCGGGGGGDSAEVTESSMSKSEYVAQANQVCEKGSQSLETDFAVFVKEAEGKKSQAKAEYVKLVETVIAPNVEAETEELRELGAPEGDLAKVKEILKAREESIAIAEEDPEAVIHNSEKVFGKASKVAGEYGLKACATR